MALCYLGVAIPQVQFQKISTLLSNEVNPRKHNPVGDPDEPMFSSTRRVSANKWRRSNLSISLRGASSYLLISGWAVWSPPARPLVLFQAYFSPGGEGISPSRGSGGGPVSVPLACTSSSWSGPVTESVLAFVDRPSLSGL